MAIIPRDMTDAINDKIVKNPSTKQAVCIYLSSAKNILHKARKGHNINKCKNTGRGDATAMPITALPL